MPYRVEYSERVRQRLIALADMPRQRGDGEEFIAALKEFDRPSAPCWWHHLCHYERGSNTEHEDSDHNSRHNLADSVQAGTRRISPHRSSRLRFFICRHVEHKNGEQQQQSEQRCVHRLT